jgi:ABC-type transporter lipoprotein component MlaA
MSITAEVSGEGTSTGAFGLLARRVGAVKLLLAIALLLFPSNTRAQQNPAPATSLPQPGSTPATGTNHVVLPQSIPDPLEPLNRAFWKLDEKLLTGIIQPTATAYRFVVRKPVRTAVANLGRNLTYPVLLINNLLEAKCGGARDETYRFLCNTFLGVGGLFDVAHDLKIPKSDADFGLTFGRWGWKPRAFLMLPIYGPSSDRDAVGQAADTAANPLLYFSPTQFSIRDPFTYFSPYTYFTYCVTYNSLSDSVDPSVRFSREHKDPYADIRFAWGFARNTEPPDFQVHGPRDAATLETLQSTFFTFKNPAFPRSGQTRSVVIPATGKDLQFSVWLQKKEAPIVYLVPGLGSHRLDDAVLALAELAYNSGFSAVCVSSPFNYEFIQNASTAAVPAYTPVDADDLHIALTKIDQSLRHQFPGRLGRRALLGYSMGAFQSLFIAAAAASDAAPLIKFDRYVAIDTPVRLVYGIGKLDQFYDAPLAWPADQRLQEEKNTFLKVAALTRSLGSAPPQGELPFSAIESQFLIGVNFRFILRDAIYASQEHDNLGVLRHPIRHWDRKALYHEILQYSYGDYFARFLIPYYQTRGIDLSSTAQFDQANDLRAHAAGLQSNPLIRVLVNQDDFLLAPADLDWLRTTFGNRLTVFPQGGHLGNLLYPDVQKQILAALDGLKSDGTRMPP